jgi:hypothetical protein
MMSYKGTIKNSKMYQRIREQGKATNKGRVPHNKGKSSPLKGKPGTPHTEKTKKHLSEIRSGKKIGPCSEERKQNISKARMGHSHSEETKLKISKSHLGQTASAETRKKMSASQAGRKHSQETRQKISDGQRGNIRGPTPDIIRLKIQESTRKFVYTTPIGIFDSIRDGAKFTGLTNEGFRNRILSTSKKWSDWNKHIKLPKGNHNDTTA